MHFFLELFCIILYYLLLLFTIKKWSFFTNSGISHRNLTLLFSIKFLFSISLYYVYTLYYTDRKTADIFKYFDDAKYLYENVYKISPIQFWKIIFGIQNESREIHSILIKTNYWFKPFSSNVFNDNRTVIRFNAVIHLFSLGYYHVHSLLLSMLSFIGLVSIFKVYNHKFKNRKKELIIACFLIPSVLFWGSGILKESILLFGLGVFILAFTKILYVKNKFGPICLGMVSICLLATTKTYILIIMIPSILAWIFIHYTKTTKVGAVFLLVNTLLIGIAFNAEKIYGHVNVLSDLEQKQRDFINVAKSTKATSTIELERLNESIGSFITTMPNAFINGLFRPSIFEIKNVFFALSAFENSTLIILLILVFVCFKKPSLEQLPYIYFGIYFTILLSILIGWTVPVLGAIVRYKIPCLPFLYCVLLLCIDFKKVKNKFKILLHANN